MKTFFNTVEIRLLKFFFLITDLGMIIYWSITYLKLIPEEFLFKDYTNPILMSWNWSFLPLDLFIPLTGLSSLFYIKKNPFLFERLALISLLFTSISGLQAVSFWTIRSDFDPNWWIPNLYLLLYPLYFIYRLLKETKKVSA
ncbi:MAG TPA: DUF5360 family protein [Leptospiraceae bacterium]|nr:DUF5360 family protein [Leptospiraceae bacterium]HMW06918.1 DUF5360 family protein [Leptospiraceae bacterium]HMX32280.1 DUF5360 family protein [Leptospiraceae bacterium]HMY33448.1 DUF5360 family protein [Leptospiraceae bacterium]HMZ65482.1 DUF5360 family protein [Leptospiraceae bacterium]